VTQSQNKRQQKSRNVAGDIMSCSLTSDKCDKFGDYFCSTNMKKLQSSLSRFGRKFCLMHVVHLITDPSPSIGISTRNSLHRIIHSLFFEMRVGKLSIGLSGWG